MTAPSSANWTKITAAAFCESVRDGTHDSPKFLDVGYPLATSKNIRGGRIVLETANLISERDYIEINRRSKVHQWDVLISMIGTVGEVCLVREQESPFAIKNIGLFKTGDELKGKWLYYWLCAPATQAALKQACRGASQQYIPLGVLRNFPIRVPRNPAIMRGIIETITPYDDLIENNRRRIALLEEAARLLYREWFVHFRFPGHEHVKIMGGFPEGWERLSASEVFAVNPTTSRNDAGTIPYVPMAALSETGMVINRTILEQRQTSTSVRFQNGDTLFARITPCLENGKTGFVNFLNDDEVACGSTEFVVLRARRVSRYFVYLTARQRNFRENAIRSMIGSSGRQRVQTSCFRRYSMAVPPAPLSTLFDEMVRQYFAQITNLDQQNQKLAEARDLLLPRLMNGEIAV